MNEQSLLFAGDQAQRRGSHSGAHAPTSLAALVQNREPDAPGAGTLTRTFETFPLSARERYRRAEIEMSLAAGDEDRYENARNALAAIRDEILSADPRCSWIPQNLGPESIVRSWFDRLRQAVNGAEVLPYPSNGKEAA